jgi:hypothetical protein
VTLPRTFDLDAFGQRWRVTLVPDAADPRSGSASRDVWRASAGDTFVEVEHRPDESREELEARLRARLAGPRNVQLP